VKTSSPNRRYRPNAALWLLLSAIAIAVVPHQVAADTLRTALYEFEVSDPDLHQTHRNPQVYMRVSNADHLITDPTEPLGPRSAARATNRFALFEFFLAPQQPNLSVSQIRFQDRGRTDNALGRLRTVLRADGAPPTQMAQAYRHPVEADTPDSALTVDLWTPERVTGVRPGEVVGLLFELSPRDSIDTLIDQRLPGGEIRPEVKVRLPDATNVWMVCGEAVHVASASGCDPTPSLFPGTADPAMASSGPNVNHASVASSTIAMDYDEQPSSKQLIRKGPSPIPRIVRARAPPTRRAALCSWYSFSVHVWPRVGIS